MLARRRFAYALFVFALVAFMCFLAAHPKFDIFVHQDSASASRTVVLTALSSSERRSTATRAVLAQAKLPVLPHLQSSLISDFVLIVPETFFIGRTASSHSDVLLI
jgi:hypothetical protein